MSADPEEENVLMSEFDSMLATSLRPALDEMVAMDVAADLEEISKPIPPAPVTPEAIEQLFTTSTLLRACGATFQQSGHWQLTYKGQKYSVTFHPHVFDEMPSLRFMTFGDPLFESLLESALMMGKAYNPTLPDDIPGDTADVFSPLTPM